jgi:predicted lipid-binding transport protein (Tim44 family)
MMKSWSMGVLVAALVVASIPTVSEAKRLGGGKSFGMQRAAPDKAAPGPAATPATPAAPAATPNTPGTPATAAAAPRRSWMGPIAGLAAGLGLAALFSHFGLGEGLANFVMLALLAFAAVFVIRLLMRRFAGAGMPGRPLAMAGATVMPREASPPLGNGAPAATAGLAIGSALQPALAMPGVATPSAPALPADFDRDGFERLAKMIFIRLQAANDGADLNDLRTFTTPELFAALRLDLHERGAAVQRTDVEQVDATLIDYAQEDDRQIVSVRFQGRVREDAGAEATPFDEVWHLVKPLDDSRAWAIAGIQQRP